MGTCGAITCRQQAFAFARLLGFVAKLGGIMKQMDDGANAFLLSCEGLSFGSIRLPRFEVGRRHAVCLRLPILSEAEDRQLGALLSGRQSSPAVHLAGHVVWVRPAQNRGGILGRFRWLRATDWLIREGGLSRAEAECVVERLARDPGVYVEMLAGNPRMLLALEAAYARGAEIIVFATRGCDPLGVEAIQEMVLSRLDCCSAIYLAYPFWDDDVLNWSPFPGVGMVEAWREPLESSSGMAPNAEVPARSKED
jgi:hypothetical protein